MKNELKQQFLISDFYIAAFCLTKGLKLLHIEKSEPRRASFVFQDTDNRQKLVEDFLFGRASVEPKSFVSAIKELKQLLHSDL